MKTLNPLSKSLKTLVLLSGMLVSSLSFAGIATDTNDNDVILSGYDTVSYFTKEAPVQGKSDISAVYNGAIYHFTSEDNRDAFKADPAKYAPQYGGFCAFGTSISQKIPVDPTIYEVLDGKLYVQSGAKAMELWVPEKVSRITSADKIWVEIKDIAADEL
ncbi:YHS domain-containing (seleno)protein [Leucothrix arctica]|uniref:YHS domain protein n=1 Tax=Leucothrix arctica TaxID=1481894 RepID=A0A317CHB4_9GAMM|nr:YHS domain-containing (seleno)protein [Leucothrix arctica]PWQ95680.1 YHS domain protein [Leucothrix arctica]